MDRRGDSHVRAGLTTISGLVWQDTKGAAQPVYYLDGIQLIAGTPPLPGQGPALTVDATANRLAISPLIYGMNFADPVLAAELRLPVNRWGGNGTTRYNWQLDTSNHALDRDFENIPNDNANPGQLPNGSSSDQFVEQNLASGTDSLVTVPLIGWTPKDRAYAGGFSVTKYGAQQSVDPWRTDYGNGVRTDGSNITGNDPADTSLAIAPSFVSDWIAHFIGRYGPAGQGGVRFYDLDNEPMLWNSTHRDVHPNATSYDELRDRTYQYAAAVKSADPACARRSDRCCGAGVRTSTRRWTTAATAPITPRTATSLLCPGISSRCTPTSSSTASASWTTSTCTITRKTTA